jgi:hypothetical protein
VRRLGRHQGVTLNPTLISRRPSTILGLREGFSGAQADHRLGQSRNAAQHLGEALHLAHRAGRSDIMAAALEGLACAAVPYDAALSARLPGAARRIRDDTGIQLTVIEGHDPEAADGTPGRCSG